MAIFSSKEAVKKIATKFKVMGIVSTYKNAALVLFITIIGAFLFIFFSCMLGFIGHAKTCFTKDGTVPMSKTDDDFNIAGNVIASIGLVFGLILFILCIVIIKNFNTYLNELRATPPINTQVTSAQANQLNSIRTGIPNVLLQDLNKQKGKAPSSTQQIMNGKTPSTYTGKNGSSLLFR
jgi:heme/copper-type cytochrome/quinol oxidase subunit 1